MIDTTWGLTIHPVHAVKRIYGNPCLRKYIEASWEEKGIMDAAAEWERVFITASMFDAAGTYFNV